MPRWRFWDKPPAEEPEQEPAGHSIPGRTASAGLPVPRPRPEEPPAARADQSAQLAALRRRRQSLLYDVEQAELATQPENPWRERMALLLETITDVERDLAALAAEPRPERPSFPATPVTIGEVTWEDPAVVAFRVGDAPFRFESDIDWAERGTTVARSELHPREGDVAALVPSSFSPDDRAAAIDHLAESLAIFAADLRRHAEEERPMPSGVTLVDLAGPCDRCGGWMAWGGHCPTCAIRAGREKQLHTEIERLRAEYAREDDERATWADRLPVALRRLADTDAAIAALEQS